MLGKFTALGSAFFGLTVLVHAVVERTSLDRHIDGVRGLGGRDITLNANNLPTRLSQVMNVPIELVPVGHLPPNIPRDSPLFQPLQVSNRKQDRSNYTLRLGTDSLWNGDVWDKIRKVKTFVKGRIKHLYVYRPEGVNSRSVSTILPDNTNSYSLHDAVGYSLAVDISGNPEDEGLVSGKKCLFCKASLPVTGASVSDDREQPNYGDSKGNIVKAIMSGALGLSLAVWGVCHLFFQSRSGRWRALIPAFIAIALGWAIGSYGGYLILTPL